MIKFVEDGKLGPDTLPKTLLPPMGQRARVMAGAHARALTTRASMSAGCGPPEAQLERW